MKLTNQQIISATNALSQTSTKGLPAKSSFLLAKNKRMLQEAAKDWEESRKSLLETHLKKGVKTEDVNESLRNLPHAFKIARAQFISSQGFSGNEDKKEKNQERKTKKSEKRYRAIFNSAPNAIFIIDQFGDCKNVNLKN